MQPDNNIEIKLLADCTQFLPQLAVLQYSEISQHWVPGATIVNVQQRLMTHINHDRLPLTVVALLNGQPIGMASLRVTDGIRPELTPWLGSLVVEPIYRGRKIGEKLIDAIKQQALAFDYRQLYLLAFDTTIPHWYAQLGWRHIGKDSLFEHSVTVMEIDL